MRLFSRSTTDSSERVPPARAPRTQRYDAFSKLLDRNNRWIEVADAKAGVVLVFVTAAVAKEMGAPAVGKVGKLFAYMPPNPAWPTVLYAIAYVVLLATLGLLLGWILLQVFLALIPALSRKATRGRVFFDDVAHQSLANFQQSMAMIEPDDLVPELLEQVHTTARIAAVKHRRVRRAIQAAVLSVPVGLALYILSLQLPS